MSSAIIAQASRRAGLGNETYYGVTFSEMWLKIQADPQADLDKECFHKYHYLDFKRRQWVPFPVWCTTQADRYFHANRANWGLKLIGDPVQRQAHYDRDLRYSFSIIGKPSFYPFHREMEIVRIMGIFITLAIIFSGFNSRI